MHSEFKIDVIYLLRKQQDQLRNTSNKGTHTYKQEQLNNTFNKGPERTFNKDQHTICIAADTSENTLKDKRHPC